jgi:glycine/D-amino acid oxidase-like deaminating enzyme
MAQHPTGPAVRTGLDRTLWWATAVGRPETAPPDGETSVDVAIVGAGFVGLTAALRLATQGVSVAVLEAGPLGAGASGVNAGFVVPNFAKADPAAVIARLGDERGHRLLRAVGGGADRVFDLVRAHAIACEAEQVGWIHVAHRPEMAAMLKARAAAWAALGRPVRYLEPDEARGRTGARHCHGALLDASGGMLNPLGYLYGLAGAAMSAGARVHTDAPVMDIVRDGADWRLSVGSAAVRARRVLLCNPMADTRANLFTCRLDARDRLISGGMAIVPFAAESRMAREIAGRLQRELDLGEVPEVAFVWRGVAAMTMDFLPHIFDFGDGLFGAIGCNGRGIALTAVVGDALAEVAAGGRATDGPIPVSGPTPVPFGPIARLAPSFAVAQAKWSDRA